jgi:serine/threonine-protein kinase
MGQVYLARSSGLGGFERDVVVKTLDSATDDDDSLVDMFLDEARVLGALHHQYIAPIYEVGCDDEGRYFLVMEYVRGDTAEAVFAALKEEGRPPPLSFALTTVAAVAAALDYAHNLCGRDGRPLEIVHRDVSPSNIMLGNEGSVKLIDFGIAKFAHRTSQTQIGSLKGKLGYLSPEQILRKPVDRRADIFALGIVLYELTTLTRAFDGGSELIMLERITTGEIALPSQIIPDYPRDLERIVMKALALDPGLRFQDAGEMGRELEVYASRNGIPIGHAGVREVMMRLFGPNGAQGRRRFPRASSEVSTGRLPVLPEPDDVDITPIDPIELVTPSEPLKRLEAKVEAPIEPEVSPLVIRIGTPTPAAPLPPPPEVRPPTPLPIQQVKVATVTAELPRRPRPPQGWWWPLLVFAVAAAVASLIALI